MHDVSAKPYGGYEPGDWHLIYPGNLQSVRMEAFRDSIEDFEKIRVLRAEGAFTAEMEEALAAIDHKAVTEDPTSVTAEKITRLVSLVNGEGK